MMTKGRVVAIAIVALGLGFVGGAWFFGSGLAFQVIAPPPAEILDGAPKARTKVAREVPHVKAVAVPRLANFNGGSGGLGPTADRTDLMPAPGCSWVIEPRPFRIGAQWHQTDTERALGGESALEPLTGGVHYLLVQSTRQGGGAIELRPVFFDAEANRYIPSRTAGSSSRSSDGVFVMTQFQLDPARQLAPDKVAYFGIELVVPNAERLLAEATQKEAKEKGIEIPPLPILGQPYPFDLPAAAGQRARAADYRGKAVLLAVFGPGGLNRFAMSPVKKIRESTKADELAIVGVSFDGSVEDAREAFANSGADSPIVFVSNDSLTRRLWRDGAQLPAIPTFYLLDREGILRFVCNPFDLPDRVDVLLGRAKRPHFPQPVRAGNPAQKAPAAPPGQKPGARGPAQPSAPQGPAPG
ncbi:MAG: hypothetical protein P4L84_18760 [Isosphaeraceae bacterium]|nr:hypothetical protein [Isosphaeraceae bacterium]